MGKMGQQCPGEVGGGGAGRAAWWRRRHGHAGVRRRRRRDGGSGTRTSTSDQRRSRDSMATTPVALKMVAAVGELNGISRNMMGDG